MNGIWILENMEELQHLDLVLDLKDWLCGYVDFNTSEKLYHFLDITTELHLKLYISKNQNKLFLVFFVDLSFVLCIVVSETKKKR